MYADYLRDPGSVPVGWQRWFASLGPAPAGYAP
ncbi:MAG: 2-oxoglutarate dehydrogenase E1 subunit family protein, partial [Candidatus Krumholzibacteriia bacterium]